MKKLITIIAISIFTLSSIFAINMKTGIGLVDKSCMQTAPYIEGSYAGVALLGDDGRIYSYAGLRNDILNDDNPELLINLQANDKLEIGCVVASFNTNVASYQNQTKLAYLKYNTFLGIQSNRFSIGAEFNGEEYQQPYDLFEKYIEVGASFNSHSQLTKHISINTKAGAYIYPTFVLSNVESNRVRENSFSTGFEAELTFTSNYFNAYVGAGIKSWQALRADVEKVTDLIGGFVPTQIRNTFRVGADVGFKDVKIFADYAYFCDHPEMTWESCMARQNTFTNSCYGILTAGIEVTF